MTLPLTKLGQASSWASLLRAYELRALDDDNLHRLFCAQLMRELPAGLLGRPETPHELYLVVRDLAEGQIRILDDMLTKVSSGQQSHLTQMRDFWAATLPGALDLDFAFVDSPVARNLRGLEREVDAGYDGDRERPDDDSWIAIIHASAADLTPLGSGLVIDERRILTCAHVVKDAPAVWAEFPKADGVRTGRPVEGIIYPDSRGKAEDLVILVLAEPVPAGVSPAPLRFPRATDLVASRWWAFGFPAGKLIGNSADGRFGGVLGYGSIRLDTTSRDPVEPGFGGAGVWSPDYQAVVAIISHANAAQGDARAITLHQADLSLPGQNFRSLSERYVEVASSAAGWSLSRDPEAIRHWRPRARGVSINSERGYRFRGRAAALRAIVSWLDREGIDRRVLVVTGAPGAGKSAVLGRIVTTADADAVAQLPTSDTAVRATVGSVACAVHARGKTALDIAAEIARAASATMPERIEDFAPAIHDALSGREGSRFNVVIDALDQAVSLAEARRIVSSVILPLAQTCGDVGAQVVVGTRRSDADGDLLGAFQRAAVVVDLDSAAFFAEKDLAAYTIAMLQLTGDERDGNPYADVAIAVPVADRIANLAQGNFLTAGLTARTHGLYDQEPADPATLSLED